MDCDFIVVATRATGRKWCRSIQPDARARHFGEVRAFRHRDRVPIEEVARIRHAQTAMFC
jgi:hypothetical protein